MLIEMDECHGTILFTLYGLRMSVLGLPNADDCSGKNAHFFKSGW